MAGRGGGGAGQEEWDAAETETETAAAAGQGKVEGKGKWPWIGALAGLHLSRPNETTVFSLFFFLCLYCINDLVLLVLRHIKKKKF
jgi:hypothetical protein